MMLTLILIMGQRVLTDRSRFSFKTVSSVKVPLWRFELGHVYDQYFGFHIVLFSWCIIFSISSVTFHL